MSLTLVICFATLLALCEELLHGCNVWVHVEVRDDPEGVLHQACQSMSKHAGNSSNLAALARLVSEMLDELNPSSKSKNKQQQQADQVAAFSERIAIVGKARAAAGALQLLRIFIHKVLVDHTNQSSALTDIFTYRSRDGGATNDVGVELLDAVFRFLTSQEVASNILQVPEMYDTAVLALQLLLVMLSTQLYQPMISSFQQSQLPPETPRQSDYFLDLIMDQARRTQEQERLQRSSSNSNGSLNHNPQDQSSDVNFSWTPKSILSTCLGWQIQRPAAPERSISRYHYNLAKSVVSAKGERLGPDGMYESNMVVSAAAPSKPKHGSDSRISMGESSTAYNSHRYYPQSSLLDATRGVLVQASSIIMLPFRLVSIALGLWGHGNKMGFEQSRKNQFGGSGASRTRDVLWVTESHVADLAGTLFLLLTNNRRALTVGGGGNESKSAPKSTAEANPFRIELSALSDNRWESGHDSSALPDLPDPSGLPQLNESISLLDSFEEPLPGSMVVKSGKHSLTLNFETLFLSFGSILHNEVGALLIYTLLQSSRAFSETIAVRSDLDTLVMPLLRTLYFSSSSRHVSALDFLAKSSTPSKSSGPPTDKDLKNNKSSTAITPLSIQTCNFRSQSQLYLIVILLLLFSQDSSFGSDAFRRTIVSTVPWYKERFLRDISLGSVLLLTLLRSLTFNLNRLHDVFFLSNCCAVLMNLSHSVVDLHEYAAMRLASVTVSCLKKYVAMTIDEKNNGKGSEDDEEEDTLLSMYSEVSHTLLRLIKHALAQKSIDRNLHLVYALVYHQADFKKVFSMKRKFQLPVIA